MRCGRLRHRIELQTAVRTKSSAGDDSTYWTTYATVWAAVEPITAKEQLKGDQVQSDNTHKIIIRYNGTVKPKSRVLLRTYSGTSGAALYNNSGCTIDTNGGLVRMTSAGNFATDLVGQLVKCDFSATYTDGVYPVTASTANSITINLAWSSDVPTAETWMGLRVIDIHKLVNWQERGIFQEIMGTEVVA